MPSVDIDLGSLEMKSKASGLRLRMTSEATFAASAKDDVDALCEGLTSPELNNSLNRPWIICDKTFKLEIALHLEHEPTPASRDDLVNILSERLRLSKVTIISPRCNANMLILAEDLVKDRPPCTFNTVCNLGKRMPYSRDRSSYPG